MKKLVKKMKCLGKKKLILIGSVAAVLVVGAVCFLIFGLNSELKNVEIVADESYAKIAEKDDLTAEQVESALADYSKSETDDATVYVKGNETVEVQTDGEGKVTYISYENKLSDNVQSKIEPFNEKQIQIGDKEKDVLKLLKNYQYVYSCKTTEGENTALHLYYYGWTGQKAALELVFKDGVLSYYTINSESIAKQSDMEFTTVKK